MEIFIGKMINSVENCNFQRNYQRNFSSIKCNFQWNFPHNNFSTKFPIEYPLKIWLPALELVVLIFSNGIFDGASTKFPTEFPTEKVFPTNFSNGTIRNAVGKFTPLSGKIPERGLIFPMDLSEMPSEIFDREGISGHFQRDHQKCHWKIYSPLWKNSREGPYFSYVFVRNSWYALNFDFHPTELNQI